MAGLIINLGMAAAAQQRAINGTVVDSKGASLSNARIQFQSGDETLVTNTGDQGNFSIAGVSKAGTLFVSCPGFASVTIEIPAESTAPIRIQLEPAPLVERIVVHPAADERIAAVPGSQFFLSRKAIETSGALALDDVLRQTPGFSLFRRSGSLSANPTSQGVSLRGVGANGASRAIVLLDGIPLNSPFGGWVYWDRVSTLSIESAEVLSGPASDAYGSGALGGVINLQSRRVRKSSAEVQTSYGNESTPSLMFAATQLAGKWSVSASGQLLRTDGYVLVSKDQRGVVDTPAGTADLAGSLTISRKLGERGRIFIRPGSFGESRRNGTPVQTNNSRIWSLDSAVDWTQPGAGDFSLRTYGSHEVLNQNFSSVALNRNSESLTNRQRNPSQQLGFAGQWRRTFAGNNALVLGVEAREVRGHSAETTFFASRATANIDAGGRQRMVGIFAQDSFQFQRTWFLTLGGRVDTWRNGDGFSNRFPLDSNAKTITAFANTTANAFSPRVSLMRTFKKSVAISGTFYRAFRAPTLNELYRNFRVGNVVTNANAALRAERLTGIDGGISFRTWSERLTLRGNLFWNQIDDAVANVTLAATPALITRQRQNLGSIRARGMELSAELQLRSNLRLSSEYLLTDSTVGDFPGNASLQGLRVPQVPLHQLNFQLNYGDQKWTGGLQGRFSGQQFDDDQNLLPLASFFTLDAEVSRRISANVKVFAAAQNVTGVRYATGRTPVTTLGPPALYRMGLRIVFR